MWTIKKVLLPFLGLLNSFRTWWASSLINITLMKVLPVPVPRQTIVFLSSALFSMSTWYGRAFSVPLWLPFSSFGGVSISSSLLLLLLRFRLLLSAMPEYYPSTMPAKKCQVSCVHERQRIIQKLSNTTYFSTEDLQRTCDASMHPYEPNYFTKGQLQSVNYADVGRIVFRRTVTSLLFVETAGKFVVGKSSLPAGDWPDGRQHIGTRYRNYQQIDRQRKSRW